MTIRIFKNLIPETWLMFLQQSFEVVSIGIFFFVFLTREKSITTIQYNYIVGISLEKPCLTLCK